MFRSSRYVCRLASLALAVDAALICHRTETAPEKITDKWCTDNCNHVPKNCPVADCICAPAPPPGPPGPPPPPSPPGPFGQQFLAYYSGVGLDTIAASGVNALAIAFFNPSALSSSPCDFSDPAGACLNYDRYLKDVKSQLSALKGNTSPKRGEKPVVLFSFGGQSMGGGAWEEVFGSERAATQFGENAAALAKALSSQVDVIAGIDLDVEGASDLPHMGSFIKAFRAKAPFDEVPLMLCTFSGLADPANSEHFKLAIVEQYGPVQQGFTWLNFMVDNQAESCEGMAKYWLDERLASVPANARLFGMWGVNNAGWMLRNPGCDDGAPDLWKWMQSQGVGFAMWELWLGDVTPIRSIADAIRAENSAGGVFL